jgi:hypothetical protein
LTQFKDAMHSFGSADGINRLAARVYMLRFATSDKEVVYPAVVVGREAEKGRRHKRGKGA